MPSVCYVNWKEDRNSPEVLTSDDLETVLKKRKYWLIARKFDFNLNDQIQLKILNDREVML